MAYLVDTNIIGDVTRGNAGAADYLDSLGDAWSNRWESGMVGEGDRSGLEEFVGFGLPSTQNMKPRRLEDSARRR